MTWTLRIPRPVPSANDHVVNGRDVVTGAIYRTRRNGWAVALMGGPPRWQHAIPAATGPRRVVLTRIMGPRQRPYDADNLASGCKLILDAMKPAQPARQTTWKSGPRKGKARLVKPVPGAGLIVDDSPRWVVVEYRQERGDAPGCRIELEDIE